MLFLKYALESVGTGMLLGALGILLYHFYLMFEYRRKTSVGTDAGPHSPTCDWGLARTLAIWGCVPLLSGMTIIVVPSGMGGVRVSQFSGTRPGTLYPGVHAIVPLVDRVAMYDIRDQVLSTDGGKEFTKGSSVFTVQAREGLIVGLAITVRYRLDARKLDYIHSNLPQPVEQELVPPVVSSVFREVI